MLKFKFSPFCIPSVSEGEEKGHSTTAKAVTYLCRVEPAFQLLNTKLKERPTKKQQLNVAAVNAQQSW